MKMFAASANLTPEEQQAIEEFKVFFRWTSTENSRPDLAWGWFDGLLTIEKGQRIEQERQVWQSEVAV